MALAMIMPAMAATYGLTVTPNRTSYIQGATVAINGTLTADAAPAAGLLVGLRVVDPQGANAFTTIAVTNAQGVYNASFSSILGTAQPTGTYTIQATASDALGNQVATATTTYTVTVAVTVVPTITLSPSTGLVTTITGAGFSPTDTITVTWGTVTMVTIPQTISASVTGSFTAIVTAANKSDRSHVVL